MQPQGVLVCQFRSSGGLPGFDDVDIVQGGTVKACTHGVGVVYNLGKTFGGGHIAEHLAFREVEVGIEVNEQILLHEHFVVKGLSGLYS